MQALMKMAAGYSKDPHAPKGFAPNRDWSDDYAHDDFHTHLQMKGDKEKNPRKKAKIYETASHWASGSFQKDVGIKPGHRDHDAEAHKTFSEGINMPWKEREKYVAQRAKKHPQSRAD